MLKRVLRGQSCSIWVNVKFRQKLRQKLRTETYLDSKQWVSIRYLCKQQDYIVRVAISSGKTIKAKQIQARKWAVIGKSLEDYANAVLGLQLEFLQWP